MINLSVIIPVYNAENYIEKCIRSLTNNVYQDIEIIIINDGSTDKSYDICRKYADKDKRIKTFSQKNKGVSAARNKGLKIAKGKYFMFVDADDYVDEKYLEKILPICKENYDVITFASMTVKDDYVEKQEIDGNIIVLNKEQLQHIKATSLFWDYRDGNNKKNALYGCGTSTAWGRVFRKSIQQKNAIFFCEDVKMFEDGIFWFEMLYYVKNGIHLKEYLYFYRQNEGSLTNKYCRHYEKLFEKRNEYAQNLIEQLYKVSLNDLDNEIVQRYFCSLLFQIGTVFEREIFNFNVRVKDRKARYRELMRYYACENIIKNSPRELLENHELKIYKFVKMDSYYIVYVWYRYMELRHNIGGLVRKLLRKGI